MTEMTPERLRLMANRRKMRGDPATAFVLRDLASAWEADRYAIKGLEYDRKRLGEDVCYLRARIEALEKELQELKDAIDGKTYLRDAANYGEMP